MTETHECTSSELLTELSAYYQSLAAMQREISTAWREIGYQGLRMDAAAKVLQRKQRPA